VNKMDGLSLEQNSSLFAQTYSLDFLNLIISAVFILYTVLKDLKRPWAVFKEFGTFQEFELSHQNFWCVEFSFEVSEVFYGTHKALIIHLSKITWH